ncbi:DUF4139 domain-containing protein [Govanella unica]|uniref:DUF4139 domain-containing protein n=1 Tax=Govanella unica TaxID=2975056 RepID=A0A9X3Z5Z3_9PROT|nr:hypothetical protein [Govania unica]MDA5192645.1 hypothetical protein [Govania unica]
MRVAVALVLWAGQVMAADLVTLPGPGTVSVTIYRDNLAMVRELRSLTLEPETRVIEFAGVSDGILPPSASVTGLPGPVREQNFDYDLLTPASLMEKSVGRQVRLIRTLPGSGKVTEDVATVLSAKAGLLLSINGKTEAFSCSGLPERLSFDALPAGLRSSPTLSAKLETSAGGPADVALQYLTASLGWSANYVATVAADGRSLDLRGMITLTNHGSVPLEDAEVFAVAGELNRTGVGAQGFRMSHWYGNCWPSGELYAPGQVKYYAAAAPVPAPMMAMAREMADQVQAEAEQLADYQLYKLPVRTTVAAHQSKQVAFLAKDGVRFEPVYRLELMGVDFDPDRVLYPAVILKLQNRQKTGLGEPLAAGVIHVLGSGPDGPYPLAEATIQDIPVGAPFEIRLPEMTTVQITSMIKREKMTAKAIEKTVHHVIRNSKDEAVTVELDQAMPGAEIHIKAASTRSEPLRANLRRWTVEVPARGERTLSYTVEVPQ